MTTGTIKSLLSEYNDSLERGFFDQRLDYKLERIRKAFPKSFGIAMDWAIENEHLTEII